MMLLSHQFFHNSTSKCLGRFPVALLSLVLFATVATAQRATDGSTPLGMSPGAPAGSYALSGFDNVNLFNGHLNFQLPLLNVRGRGGAGYQMTLPVEQTWSVFQQTNEITGVKTFYPEANPWNGLKPGYGPGVLQGRKGGNGSAQCSNGGGGFYPRYTKTLTRLTFIAGDGTEYELRDTLTAGEPKSPVNCLTGFNRGRIFISADGSAATFISDADIVDTVIPVDYPVLVSPSGYLMLRDGTRYRIDVGTVTWMRDRNGNKLTFTYDTYKRVASIVDSLAREITITYAPLNSPGYDSISYKGFGQASRAINVNYDYMQNVLYPGQSIQTYQNLFPELINYFYSQQNFNPIVVASVTLPNSQQYQLKYNSYGELARAVLPTGGAFEYDYMAGLTDGFADGVMGAGAGSKQIYRRVVERREYPDGGTGASYASKMTYSRPETTLTGVSHVITDQCTLSGTTGQCGGSPALLSRQYHYFYGSGRDSFFQNAVSYGPWQSGREYKTESFATDGTTVLRRLEHTFAQRAPVSWWTSDPLGAPPNDPRLTESVSTIEPNGANLASKQTFDYDQYNNQTDVNEYDYGTGAPGAFVQRTHTDYLTNNDVNGASYDTLNPSASNPDVTTTVHIRNLPREQWVSTDVAGTDKRARTTYEYDNYVGTNHAALQTYPRPSFTELSISGLDAAFNSSTGNLTRGNVTATTRDLLGSGTITAFAQFDVAGNLVKTIDARGYVTSFDFGDHFGTPNDEARANTNPQELITANQNSYAFTTLVTNALGQKAYTQFDYYIGQAVNSEDANGAVSSGDHIDVLERLTQLISAANQIAGKSQSPLIYDDINRKVTGKSDLETFNDNKLKAETLYDKFARPIESRNYEEQSKYIAVQTQYDALGRAFKVSNPFRLWKNESPVWTTTAFDALGRPISVTSADGAVVSTAYSGDRVLVTDQAGKQRMSRSNAQGQLTDLWEVTAPESGVTEGISFPGHPEVTAGYRTSYSYDVLDNLISVAQGNQTRTFVYDSLKRLTSATNPESGTVSYQYDNNGNLTQKTDARGVVSTYGYDALNRNNSVTYSDGTPAVTRTYDGATNGVARLWKTETDGQSGSRTTIDSYDALGRPLKLSQQFNSNGSWSVSYTVQRSYDLAGHVLTQTYPSGHTVSYNYDAAGRLADKDAQHPAFSGNLGDGVTRTYASEFQYTSRNSLEQEKLGTNTPLYHKQQYNVRGQLWGMRLSTVPFNTDPANGDRGAIVNHYTTANNYQDPSGGDNNGNLLRQETYIPGSDFFQQTYDYDSLSRLKWVAEKLNGTGNDTFKQAYLYDRWGNRRIDQGNTTANVPHPEYTVDDTHNRLNAPAGFIFEYDAAGNQTRDNTSNNQVGQRNFDAENRMTGARVTKFGPYQWTFYTYDGDGQRVRRRVFNLETWQVYGFDGELLAEYPQTGASLYVGQPQKEYGYRNGQLLVTAQPFVNIAWNKPATQTDDHAPTTTANKAVDGNANGALWDGAASATTNTHANSWWQVDLQSVQNIDSITVWGRTDCCPDMTSNFYVFVSDSPFTSYDLSTTLAQSGVSSYYNGYEPTPRSVPVNRTGRYVRVQLAGTNYLVLGEVQVWSAAAKVNWTVTDHLGTPRMIADKTGSTAGISRHDYLPFGEEILGGVGGRTLAQGYEMNDGIRQQFTQKERDIETGLDYFLARYYASTQGRFTSADEFSGGPDELYDFVSDAADNPTFYADLTNPQSLNKYQFVYNNPLSYVDPDGHDPQDPKANSIPVLPVWPIVTPTKEVTQALDKAREKVADAAKELGKDAAKMGADAVKDTEKALVTVVVIASAVKSLFSDPPPAAVPAPPQTATPTTGTPAQTQAKPQTDTAARMSPRPIDKPRDEGHKKGKRDHDKHTRPRPGDKKPPGFKPRVPKRPQDMEPKK